MWKTFLPHGCLRKVISLEYLSVWLEQKSYIRNKIFYISRKSYKLNKNKLYSWNRLYMEQNIMDNQCYNLIKTYYVISINLERQIHTCKIKFVYTKNKIYRVKCKQVFNFGLGCHLCPQTSKLYTQILRLVCTFKFSDLLILSREVQITVA